VAELSRIGVELSIDDFGTGHSSLAKLRSLPISEIKLDKSFVGRMRDQRDDAIIVRSTIELGRNLGLRVVAEGVEDEATADLLREYACDVIQGFWCGRPQPAERLTPWLHTVGAALSKGVGAPGAGTAKPVSE
jgi:EAL domain-containing protein (putative c-di-GMP-specific phosphodiesterase class I)